MHATSIMLPTTIEWCNEDDRIQKRILTSSTNSSSRCWSRTSSLSLFSDEFPDSKKCSLVKKTTHVPLREITKKPAVRPSITESKWNLGVEDLLVEIEGVSTKSTRRIMDRDSLLPESRSEAFRCLRRLDQWSDEIERQSMQQTVVPVEMHQRRHSNPSLVRIKGSQLRRRLFSSDRESSFYL